MKVVDDNAWLTPPKVGEILGVCAETVRYWIKQGMIEYVNISPTENASYRISGRALNEFLTKRTSPSTKENFN